tara:strand:+ start:493 stop:885 length:393 start_codon:yes stop_codon:yes gene_type:complete
MWNFKNVIKSFTYDEMACKNCAHCGGLSNMNETFMIKLQSLRDACGFPLPVNSGFRCKQKNIDCGGHENSGHLTGEAADLRCDRDKARVVIQKAIEMGFSVGIQQKGNGRFVHVDTKLRRSGKANLWSYA